MSTSKSLTVRRQVGRQAKNGLTYVRSPEVAMTAAIAIINVTEEVVVSVCLITAKIFK